MSRPSGAILRNKQTNNIDFSGTYDECVSFLLGYTNMGKVALNKVLRHNDHFGRWNIEPQYAQLPVEGYNMGAAMSFRETPWWDMTAEQPSSGAELEPFVRDIKLREEIYNTALGIKPAIYRRFYEEQAKLFPMPQAIVCAETKTMRVHDGTNAWDTTLQEFIVEQKLILNKFVLLALLSGHYADFIIEWNPDYWNKINLYTQMFEEAVNDPNREIQ